MDTRMIARDLAEDAPHSLSERIARFAMAINGCTGQNRSKSYWKQAKQEWRVNRTRPRTTQCLNQHPTPNAGTRCPAQPDTMCQSCARDFKPGDALTYNSGWRECFIFSPKEWHPARREVQPFSVCLGASGMAERASLCCSLGP